MTVKELLEKLKHVPEHAVIIFHDAEYGTVGIDHVQYEASAPHTLKGGITLRHPTVTLDGTRADIEVKETFRRLSRILVP